MYVCGYVVMWLCGCVVVLKSLAAILVRCEPRFMIFYQKCTEVGICLSPVFRLVYRSIGFGEDGNMMIESQIRFDIVPARRLGRYIDIYLPPKKPSPPSILHLPLPFLKNHPGIFRDLGNFLSSSNTARPVFSPSRNTIPCICAIRTYIPSVIPFVTRSRNIRNPFLVAGGI
jgi:hypothetical protein